MSVAPGTRFGPYTVVAPLGAGGFGEVYRATDSRLGRTVALKVLAADVVRDAVARERFHREARLVAQLQHPHICVLHDVGVEADTPYLVMELLHGETLDAHLARGPLPLDEALALGAQIAHALDAAHRQGIVHRDLKPANVMLVSAATGTDAKLLDFGVARLATTPRTDGTGEATYATGATTAALTDRHSVVGTLPYMAPEQLAGQPADARTDLWALGCVLYEMLSGARPFAGQTTARLMAAILEHPPAPLAERVPHIPPSVDRVVRRCLEKDPERRWQSARDLGFELESASTTGSPTSAPSRATSSRTLALGGWALAAVIAGLAVVSSVGRQRPPAPPPVVRLSISPPEGTTFLGGRSAPYFALSPDGTELAVVPTPYRQNSAIWLRPLDATSARRLPDTEGATYPFWSPDGTRLGFFADGKLKIFDTRNGRSLILCDAPTPRGGTWNRTDDILFTPAVDSAVFRVSAGGGTPAPVTTLDASRREGNHKLPTFLPDGRHFLFVNQSGSAANTGLYVGSLDSPGTRRLIDAPSRAEVALGLLWYARDGSLVVQDFDVATLTVSGTPRVVGDEVAMRNTIIGDALFSLGPDGTAVIWSGPQAATTQLVWYDRAGRQQGTVGEPDRHFSIALSPDARTIAAEIPDPEGPFYNIWTIDVATGTKTRLTSGSLNWGPVWAPDSSRLAYGSTRNGPSDVYYSSVAGPRTETTAWASRDFTGPTSWLPGRSGLLLLDSTHLRLGVLTLGSTPTWIPNDGFIEGDGRVSPDGRWLAYTSNESGSWDVYVKPFPAMDTKWRVSPAGGSGPVWRPDSGELYFIDRSQRLVAVSIAAGSAAGTASPITGTAATLFSLPVVPVPPGVDPRLLYAPNPRGDRFLVNAVIQDDATSALTVVLNLPGRVHER